MNKLTVLASSMAVVFSASTFANPPAPPSIYDNGPFSPTPNLQAPEKVGYALLEASMQVAEAAVVASSCASLAGGEDPVPTTSKSYPLHVESDGVVNGSSDMNFVQVNSDGESFTVSATLAPNSVTRGQKLTLQSAPGVVMGLSYGISSPGILKTVAIRNFQENAAYSKEGKIYTAYGTVEVHGNGLDHFDLFSSKKIKDFYRQLEEVTLSDGTVIPGVTFIYDWGLQAVDKFGYPVNKYWQRSRTIRDNGFVAHTVFQKDRLVGATACRITVEASGTNNASAFNQDGRLTIAVVPPSDTSSSRLNFVPDQGL